MSTPNLITKAPPSQEMRRDGGLGEGEGQAVCKITPRPLDASVWRHDVFNLVALGIVNSMNLMYLLKGEGFELFWWTTMAYFLADFIWVALSPTCVKAPRVILAHHIVSALYTLLPYAYPALSLQMCYVMTVEVNTWLLIARRVLPSPAVTFLFFTTWVLIRNLFLPYLVYPFYLTYRDAALESGSPWHPVLLAPLFQVVLCCLNFKWTVDLYVATVRRQLPGKSHQL